MKMQKLFVSWMMGNALEGKPMVVAAGYSWPGDKEGIKREESEEGRDASEAVFPRIETGFGDLETC